MGPSGISWQDFDAWARLTGNDPTPRELDVLSAMDNAFFEAAHPPKTKQRERES